MAELPPALRRATELPLRCPCGALRGVYLALPAPGARGVCYCDDCQAYARFLGGADLVNAHGGTEVIQSWPAQVRLADTGTLALVRLSAKGLHRWYAGCCRTPIANTMASPALPFTGVLRRALAVDDATLDDLYGPAQGVQGRFAVGGCPPDAHASASLPIIARAMAILARGAWAGGHRPSPFFEEGGRTVVEAQILGVPERAALGG